MDEVFRVDFVEAVVFKRIKDFRGLWLSVVQNASRTEKEIRGTFRSNASVSSWENSGSFPPIFQGLIEKTACKDYRNQEPNFVDNHHDSVRGSYIYT